MMLKSVPQCVQGEGAGGAAGAGAAGVGGASAGFESAGAAVGEEDV